jgi:hypothetical protein
MESSLELYYDEDIDLPANYPPRITLKNLGGF